MTLLSIAQGLAKNVGLAVPAVVMTSDDRSSEEIVEMSNAVGEELARRVDWGNLTSSVTLTGDGTNLTFDLGQYSMRISPGVSVTSGASVLRPLTQAEWPSLAPAEGVPRYYLLRDKSITLWPYLAIGETATVSVQLSAWCSNGTDKWSTDFETSLIDEDLMVKGLIVRWRRQKGMSYEDYEAEYEAALADYASFDDRSRLT